MTERHLINCPECGGELRRLIGAGAGPIFKGSGFYQTDYKNTSKKSNEKSSTTTSPKPTTTKTEKKTSPKTAE
jgi:predicted nucleic acid-binding Zn ribbon protein